MLTSYERCRDRARSSLRYAAAMVYCLYEVKPCHRVHSQTAQVCRSVDERTSTMSEMPCHICGSTDLEERLVEYIYRRRGNYLVVRDVPCRVCLPQGSDRPG